MDQPPEPIDEGLNLTDLTKFHVSVIVLLAFATVMVILMFYLGVRAGQRCRGMKKENYEMTSPSKWR